MKLVIDIDEKNYMSCQTSEYARKSIYFDLVHIIRRGTILPKGHGRLIDADVLIEQIKKSICIDCNSYNKVRCRACQYDDEMADIDDALTIIEADKAESEGE